MKIISKTPVARRKQHDITTQSSTYFIRLGTKIALIHNSPSIVFGTDPKTRKFFVATKSAFNKDPKINYTDEDIEKNHGHAPGLVDKLKQALHHLPKVTPKAGVYQGDLMYSKDDVHEHGGEYHFTPNTIMYSTPKNSLEGKKIKDAKLGIVVHSKYHGPSLDKMNVGFEPDLTSFKDHKDVHVISPEVEPPKANASTTFEHHIKRAEKEFNEAPTDTLDVTSHHTPHLKTYINKTVREKTTPTTAGFRRHLMEIGEKNAVKVSTAKAKQRHINEMMGNLKYVEDHAKHYDALLKIHHHIQAAKNELVKSLSKNSKYEHSVDGKPVKPEGFVAVKSGHPIKLVDRSEFSFHNLNRQR